jgi:MFS family permease
MGFGKFQILLMIYAGIAWMGESMELMLLSFIGPSVHAQWNLSSTQESYLSSIVFIGMLIGAYSWGIVSDSRGRRYYPLFFSYDFTTSCFKTFFSHYP